MTEQTLRSPYRVVLILGGIVAVALIAIVIVALASGRLSFGTPPPDQLGPPPGITAGS